MVGSNHDVFSEFTPYTCSKGTDNLDFPTGVLYNKKPEMVVWIGQIAYIPARSDIASDCRYSHEPKERSSFHVG